MIRPFPARSPRRPLDAARTRATLTVRLHAALILTAADGHALVRGSQAIPEAPVPSTLVVEDDPAIAEVVAYQLTKAGHQVVTVGDGVEALRLARSGAFQLMVLDLMLPGMSGIDALRVLRRESAMPVVVLSARDGDADQVMALELGADDYVTKPFSMRQLLARIAALMRRTTPAATTPDNLDDYALVIDETRHEVRKRGTLIPLPPKVFEVLVFLARNQNRVCSRHEVLDAVWGDTYDGQTRTLDVHIHWLRQRIEDDPRRPRLVETIRQYGYRFRPFGPGDGDRAILVSDAPPGVPPVTSDLVTRGPQRP